MSELDHYHCPPSAHDFDPDGTRPEEQARDEHGRRVCNDCGALCFYGTGDDQYHHAGRDAEPCFLVQEENFDIPVPDAIPVPADWPGNEVNRL